MSDNERSQESLSGFLLARIAEDEAGARAATPSPWVAASGYVETPEMPELNFYGGLWDCEGSESLCMSRPTAEHVARHEPARVLARCEADRRIVEVHAHNARWDDTNIGEWARATLQLLALPYADHPDYDEGWRP